jgi:hypothetical protein
LELSKNNTIHSHIVVGIKNLTSHPQNIVDNMRILIRTFSSNDLKIEFLEKFINCKRVWAYLYKNNNECYFFNFFNFNIYNQQLFSKFLDFIELEVKCIITGFTVYVHDKQYIEQNKEKKDIFEKLKKVNSIIYTKEIIEKEHNVYFILNLYIYYFLLNGIKIYNDHYIKKIKTYSISYKILIKKSKLVDLFDDVIDFFLQYLDVYIKNIDLYFLKKNTLIWANLPKKLELIDSIVNIKIDVLFTFIEFKDGIYDLKSGNLINKNNLKSIQNFEKIGTLKYTFNTYKYCKPPKIWLRNMCEKLNYNWDEINDLFFHLAIIFSTNYEDLKKKRVLFILGKSNTLKTTLIADIFIEYFGTDNIAVITQSKNFPFQNFENKVIALLDEFKYYDTLHNEYLKLFENRQIYVEKKFQDAISINPLHIVIISNEDFIKNQTNKDKQQALQNRIKIFEFLETNSILLENMKESIKHENINIVVFLIKYYNEFLKIKKDKRKNKIKKYLDNTNKNQKLLS